MTDRLDFSQQQQTAASWFRELRDAICGAFEQIEQDYTAKHGGIPGRFERKLWNRDGGGGGEMSLMRSTVFEKVGVNISVVHGEFSEAFRKEIPGAKEDPRFWAAGISLVAHMTSPKVPAVHMNTRMITTNRLWFGGGADLNPTIEGQNAEEIAYFHAKFKAACDRHDPAYYPRFKEECDRYFWLPHRNEPRGAGGIFYDYLNTDDWQADFAFTQEVGRCFLESYPAIVRCRMEDGWTEAQRAEQLQKRGRYAEFNLIHDRGTRFGLMTGGNTEAILMSLPPVATW